MPGKNLTRDEARERADRLDVTAYTVELDLTDEGPTFRSTTVIVFSAAGGAETFIDLIAPEVTELSLNGRSLERPPARDEGAGSAHCRASVRP